MHNGKKFQIMYDEVSKRKFFYQIVDNAYILPSEEDSIYLFERFNPIVLYMRGNNNQFSNESDDNKNKIEYIVNYGVKMIRVTICTIALGMCLEFVGHNYITKPVSTFIPYSIESMVEKTIENKNLTKEEKTYIISCFNIIEDNQEYINTFAVEERLKHLKINYGNEGKDGCLGIYNPVYDFINIYDVKSFDEICNNKLYIHCLSHEISHVFGSDSNIFLGRSFAEAVNEQFTREYIINDVVDSYTFERMCLYSLCEIINPDDFKELHFRGGCKLIIDDLTNIIDDKKMAYELIGNIDSLNYYERKIYNDEEDSNELNEQYMNTRNEIYDSISRYFYAKYGYNIEYDKIMMTYLVNSGFCNDVDTPYKVDNVTRIVSKGYFSSDYKVNNPNTIYYKKIRETEKASEYKIVKIKNINREIHKEYLEENGFINNNQSNEDYEGKKKMGY